MKDFTSKGKETKGRKLSKYKTSMEGKRKVVTYVSIVSS